MHWGAGMHVGMRVHCPGSATGHSVLVIHKFPVQCTEYSTPDRYTCLLAAGKVSTAMHTHTVAVPLSPSAPQNSLLSEHSHGPAPMPISVAAARTSRLVLPIEEAQQGNTRINKPERAGEGAEDQAR